jgi:hypothetical protein
VHELDLKLELGLSLSLSQISTLARKFFHCFQGGGSGALDLPRRAALGSALLQSHVILGPLLVLATWRQAGALGPDEMSFMFYQRFWEFIRVDLMEMFDDFFEGKVDLYKLNFALIIIIPKEKYVRTMNKFRPISLLNCSYKIFTWVSTSRIGLMADRFITSNQIAFVKGRYILESVVTAHETLHNVHQRKQHGFVLKLD